MRRTFLWNTAILSVCVGIFSIGVAGAQASHPAAERITNGPVVEGIGPSWAVVAWSTNTGGSTVLHYGTDRNQLSQTAESPYADNERTKGQVHRVRIAHLKPKTTYYFSVDSGQGEGTGTDARSGVKSFTTKSK